ncbi:DUF2059 domain-containing protein [Citromicrobium bathyomarinum]|uniref:DUF2059 domain-containing protein n=1 Tax=Citromicrobium bathyomarinum TaxID=72174 RepID=UPI00315A74FF
MKKLIVSTALGSLAVVGVQPVIAQESDVPPVVVSVVRIDDSHEDADAAETDQVWFEDDSDEAGGDDDAMAMAMVTAMLSSMFEAEPLTAEAEARLPLANSVAASLVPEGIYGEMMGQMIESFLAPIFKMANTEGGMSTSDLANYTGVAQETVEALTDEQRAELTDIFDPVYQSREQAKFDGIVSGVNMVFGVLEPGVRDGLARAYASKFETSELAELESFFATPVGAKFASQSLLLNADPQVISGMMDTIPSLIEKLPMLTESFEDAADGLPEPRRYDDLTPSEQRRAAEMLGIDQSTLRESMAAAEAMEEEAMTIDMSDWSDEELDAAADALEDEADGSMDSSDDNEGESFAEAMEDVGGE